MREPLRVTIYLSQPDFWVTEKEWYKLAPWEREYKLCFPKMKETIIHNVVLALHYSKIIRYGHEMPKIVDNTDEKDDKVLKFNLVDIDYPEVNDVRSCIFNRIKSITPTYIFDNKSVVIEPMMKFEYPEAYDTFKDLF